MPTKNAKIANLQFYVDPLLRLSIKHDSEHDLWWRLDDLDLFEAAVPCNDFFWWGTADAENIMIQEIPFLEQAYEDCKAAGDLTQFWGGSLFVARKRKMRPQGAQYSSIPEELWPLFNEAGPTREVDFGNPYGIGEYKRGQTPEGEETNRSTEEQEEE